MMKLSDAAAGAIKRLESAGYEAYAVGGCVRDSILGMMPKDYDIATSATPEETEQVFSDRTVIETGKKHGTVTVLLECTPLEITTFRVEAGYSDGRHPDSVSFTGSLKEDLARRDFTVNAMAYSDRTGVIDYFGGEADIHAGVIRCVGSPEKRFGEDALRILRALRFAATLGFSIAPETDAALRANAGLLSRISAERISSELYKLLCGRDVRRILLDYVDVIGVIIPELLPMKGFDQHNRHHIYDVLEHTAGVVANIEAQPVLRLAALLHDVGKPSCFTLDTDGVGHFHGHAEAGALIADRISARLKLDRSARRLIMRLITLHRLKIASDDRSIRHALSRLTPEVFFPLVELMRADDSAKNPSDHDGKSFIYIAETARRLIDGGVCFSLDTLAVNGDDLRGLGVTSGENIGLALGIMLDAVIDGKAENEREALCGYAVANLPDSCFSTRGEQIS